MQFLGANPSSPLSGEDLLPAKINYLIGPDTKSWKTGIPAYRKVTYTQLYPGINLEFFGNRQGFEYDFILNPGGNPASIDLAFTGIDKISLDDRGNLLLDTGRGVVTQPRPIIYQETGGIRTVIDGGYRLIGTNRFGFRIGAYDPSKVLVIDPTIDFSTFLGGSGTESFGDMTVDPAGNICLVGTTSSPNFPVSDDPLQGSMAGSYDLFIAKFDPSGSTLLFSTYLGGTGSEWGQPHIAVDGGGNIYVTGTTGSTDFPVSPWAFQTIRADSNADFVAKLDPLGTTILYATLLDATQSLTDFLNEVTITDLAVDLSGNAFVTGYTNSRFFPTTPGALKDFLGGNGFCGTGKCYDAFVTKFDLTGSALDYSTYLGDANPGGEGAWGQNDRAFAIAVDSAGNAYVTGNTAGPAFPVTAGAFQTEYLGGGMFGVYGDAFVSKLDSTGETLVYSTFLGGSNLPEDIVGGADIGLNITVDRMGRAYVTGSTSSKDFPVTLGAYQRELNFGGDRCAAAGTENTAPCPDAFIAELDPTGSSLLYATYLGGLDYDSGKSIAVDAAGVVHVAGGTDSVDFPLTEDAFQVTSLGGGGSCYTTGDACYDAFVAKLSTTGDGLIYATYLGGSSAESSNSGITVKLNNKGDFYVAGDTESADFPLLAPYQSTNTGRDIFIAKFGDPTPLNDNMEFVKQVYRDFLNREAEQAGLDYWVGQLSTQARSRAEVVEQFLLSPEFGEKVAPITRLYFAFFTRIPDYGGLMYWMSEYMSGNRPLQAIAEFFAASPEFQQAYGNLNNTEFVTLVYQNVLGRAPDAGGLAFWTNELDTGSQTRGQVMIGFSESPEYQSMSRNKVYVTMAYISLLRRSPEQGGFDFWVGWLDQGASGLTLIDGFLASEEYASRVLISTAAEPSNAGDYLPFTLGHNWVFQGTYSLNGSLPTGYDNIMTVIGREVVDNVKTTIFRESNPDNLGAPEESYLYKNLQGISYYGNSDPTDRLTPQLVPYQLVHFPVQVGSSFVQVDKVGLDYGKDLDGDNKNELFDIYSTVTVVGLESQTVPTGVFSDCAQVRTNVTLSLRSSNNNSLLCTLTDIENSWYAPAVGPVKSTSTINQSGLLCESLTETTGEVLAGHFTLLAADLAPADSDTEYPGKPAVGYDGTNYLVVTRQVAGPTSSMMTGIFVNAHGEVLRRIDLGPGDTEWTLSSNRPSIAFDGRNYVVVFARNGQIIGQRVTSAGEVLDGPEGFEISGLGSNYFPAVAFDGTNFLVAWGQYSSDYDIHGALISPTGEVLSDFVIFSAEGNQSAPGIAFDGSNFLVAWSDSRWDGVSEVVDIYATRVSPAGVALDPAGIPISTAAGYQGEPTLVFGGSNYFVAWTDGRVYASEPGQIPGLDIYGARVAPNGSVLDPGGIPVNTKEYMAYNGKGYPTVAFDGKDYFVAWQTGSYPSYPLAGVFGNWVTTGGVVKGAAIDSDGLSISGAPTALAKYVYPTAVSGNEQVFLVWINLIETVGEFKDLYGVIVTD